MTSFSQLLHAWLPTAPVEAMDPMLELWAAFRDSGSQQNPAHVRSLIALFIQLRDELNERQYLQCYRVKRWLQTRVRVEVIHAVTKDVLKTSAVNLNAPTLRAIEMDAMRDVFENDLDAEWEDLQVRWSWI